MQSFVILCRSSSVYLAGPVASPVLGVGDSSAEEILLDLAEHSGEGESLMTSFAEFKNRWLH